MKIAWAEASDAEALVPLLLALHRHDVADAIEPDRIAILDHASRLIDPATPHRLLVAWDSNGAVVRLAAIAIFTSVSESRPGKSRQMELKELFVLPAARGQGLGEGLMKWIEAFAVREGAARIDWHVKRDNGRGIAFYERLGASIVDGRLSMRKLVAG